MHSSHWNQPGHKSYPLPWIAFIVIVPPNARYRRASSPEFSSSGTTVSASPWMWQIGTRARTSGVRRSTGLYPGRWAHSSASLMPYAAHALCKPRVTVQVAHGIDPRDTGHGVRTLHRPVVQHRPTPTSGQQTRSLREPPFLCEFFVQRGGQRAASRTAIGFADIEPCDRKAGLQKLLKHPELAPTKPMATRAATAPGRAT